MFKLCMIKYTSNMIYDFYNNDHIALISEQVFAFALFTK